MTYDPGRRGGNRAPVLRNEWREPLRAQRDPLAEDEGRLRANRDDRQQFRKQTWLGRFVSTYGWRAYALPVLVVITGLVLYQTFTGTGVSQPVDAAGPIQGPPTIGAPSTAIVGAPPKGMTQFDANLPTGILPDGGPITEAGAKTWHIVPGTTDKVGQGTTKSFTYTVEVEDGRRHHRVRRRRSLRAHGQRDPVQPQELDAQPAVRVHPHRRRAPQSQPDFRVSLTSPMTVREGCGYDIPLEASCFNPAYLGDQSRVFVNEARWVRGAVPFQGDIGSYRQYLINHEVGHAIGYQRARAVRRERRARSGDDAADVLHQQRRRRQVRPRVGQARRQDLPVQPVAVPDRLSESLPPGPRGKLCTDDYR